MVLSNAIVHFEPDSPARQDVEISNAGDEPLYVQIEPHLVRNPGTAQEERVLIKNPREHGLLVTPSRMVLAPGTAKSMRLVKLALPSDPDQKEERIYRISARPVVGELTAEQTGLKVLIGYEVLAIVYPKSPAPDLVVERQGKTLTAHNKGNTNVLLQEGFQCERPEQPLEDCAPVQGKRMYPGLSWSVELSRDLPVRFFQSVGTRNYVEIYD
jgi:P pilus assembly chaperone PapD